MFRSFRLKNIADITRTYNITASTTMESERLVLQDSVYISTLSDLGTTWTEDGSNKSHMLKLDVIPGVYSMVELNDGYVLASKGYVPHLRDIIKIFSTRDADKGLSGTYYGGDSTNLDHLRLLNTIRDYLSEDILEIIRYNDSNEMIDSDDEWDENLEGYEEFDSGTEVDLTNDEREKKLRTLPCYHNLPVLFYLNQSLNEDDLVQISLKFANSNKYGNVERTWRVVHDQYGDIGMAVQQTKLINMMGDQAGLAFLSTTTANAFGNFDLYKHGWKVIRELFGEEEIDCPDYRYVCKFNRCNCDWHY